MVFGLPWGARGAGAGAGARAGNGGGGGGVGGGGGRGVAARPQGVGAGAPGDAALWRVRVVVRGARGSGKTALVERLGGGGFSDRGPSPPGTAPRAVPWQARVGGEEAVVLEVWDVTDADCASPGPPPPEDLETFLEGARAAPAATSPSLRGLGRGRDAPSGRTLALTSASSDQIYRGCHCCLLCYHPGDPATWDWAQQELQRVPGGVPVALIAGFRDLGPSEGAAASGWAPLAEARTVCDEVSRGRPVRVRCLEVSAKDCFGLGSLYNFLHIPFLLYKRSEMKKALDLNAAALGEASEAIVTAGEASYADFRAQLLREQEQEECSKTEEGPRQKAEGSALPEARQLQQVPPPPAAARPRPSDQASGVQKLVAGLGSVLGGGRRQHSEDLERARMKVERQREAEQAGLRSKIGDGVPDGFFDSDDDADDQPAIAATAVAPAPRCSPDRPVVLWEEGPGSEEVKEAGTPLTPLDSPTRTTRRPQPLDREAEFFADCSENPGTEQSSSSPDSSGLEGPDGTGGSALDGPSDSGGAFDLAAAGSVDASGVSASPVSSEVVRPMGPPFESGYGVLDMSSAPEASSEGMLADASEGPSEGGAEASPSRLSGESGLGGGTTLEDILAQAQAGLATQLSEAEAQAERHRSRKHRKSKSKSKHRKRDRGGLGQGEGAPEPRPGSSPAECGQA